MVTGFISGVSSWKGHWLFLQAWVCQSRASQWFDREFSSGFCACLGFLKFSCNQEAHQPTNAVRLGTAYSIWFSLLLVDHRSHQDKSETQPSPIKENYLLVGYSLRDKWWWEFLYGPWIVTFLCCSFTKCAWLLSHILNTGRNRGHQLFSLIGQAALQDTVHNWRFKVDPCLTLFS